VCDVSKLPAADEEYPEFDDYPECGDGWMNEELESTHVDMCHQLIPIYVFVQTNIQELAIRHWLAMFFIYLFYHYVHFFVYLEVNEEL
jgi:hypothetical protein